MGPCKHKSEVILHGEVVVLEPYGKEHVPIYHEWMQVRSPASLLVSGWRQHGAAVYESSVSCGRASTPPTEEGRDGRPGFVRPLLASYA